MNYVRMPIEIESPEQMGYENIRWNLSESSVADRKLSSLGCDLGDTLLMYGDHRGTAALRSLIAADDPSLTPDDVLITQGAAGALFIIASGLLKQDDHIVAVRPNYATNLETPRAIGCDITYIDLSFEKGYRLDMEEIDAAIRPDTRFVSVTYPHNPTGVMITRAEQRALIDLTATAGCRLLFDETYREMAFSGPLPVAGTLAEHVISVSSLSKTYGIPGVRIGWLITRDADLMELMLAAKEQIGISCSVLDEAVAVAALRQRPTFLPENARRIRRGFEMVRDWVAGDDFVEWVEPGGGCICFPRIRPDTGVNTDVFYRTLFEAHGTYVGAGRWFEQSDLHFRIGYAWPTLLDLERGLAAISKAIRTSRQAITAAGTAGNG